MRDGDVFVDHEAFDLGKGVVVGRVNRFVAKNFTDYHATKRWFQQSFADLFVGPALHRAGVRAQ